MRVAGFKFLVNIHVAETALIQISLSEGSLNGGELCVIDSQEQQIESLRPSSISFDFKRNKGMLLDVTQ